MFDIQEELKKLPEKPGVYIMKDKEDHILYVGKAVVLKNRVRQYFQKNNKSARIEKMVSLIDHFEYIVVDSEMEALILECNLIKLHRPKFNVLLKDDKMYPYIKITVNEEYPTVKVTRKKIEDGAKYFGPYTNGYAVKETLDLINKLFMLKQCKKDFSKKKADRPCLNYHIKRCMGVCMGLVDKEVYQGMIEQIMLLLEGKTEEILKIVDQEMKVAAQNLNYEKAAELRDKRISIENLIQKQKMDNFSENDIDVIGIVKLADQASIQIFFIRNSKMVGSENFILKQVEEVSESELLSTFMKQYYTVAQHLPNKIMFRYAFEDIELVHDWLREKNKGKNIEFKVPKIGEKMRFIEMAEKNAEIALKNKTDTIEEENMMLKLKEMLNLKELPRKIESYDISNISGTDIVAGMVVFENAKPKRSAYRRLKIKTVEGQDDPACMKEVLMRRLKYAVGDYEGLQQDEVKNPFGRLPDLILMDGGITQIRAAQSVVNAYHLEIPVYGMVKDYKHRTRGILDIHGNEIPIEKEEIFHFVTRIQDEVHKTAIEYHRKLRDKKIRKSELDTIDGIGEVKKKALLKKFKSVERIRSATIEELTCINGISENLAISIKEQLENQENKV